MQEFKAGDKVKLTSDSWHTPAGTKGIFIGQSSDVARVKIETHPPVTIYTSVERLALI